jgi:hypothetical protein
MNINWIIPLIQFLYLNWEAIGLLAFLLGTVMAINLWTDKQCIVDPLTGRKIFVGGMDVKAEQARLDKLYKNVRMVR